jgi:transposase
LNLRVPGPEKLSRAELLALLAAGDEALTARDARIDGLLVTVGDLTAQVQALVLKLGKDSSNSSKPPSSDGPGRRPRGGSSRKSSGREPGKQPGAAGAALRLVDDPTEWIGIPAPAASPGSTGRSGR